jgi:hypothetical protein
MTKAILLLDPDGCKLSPATLCAETAEEALTLNLPLFDHVISELGGRKEMRASGNARYELMEDGRRVGVLEIFDPPRLEGPSE